MAEGTKRPQKQTAARTVRRLNWGCGSHVCDGWINSDAKDESGVDLVCDIRDGLCLESESMDYAVSIHALPELAYREVVPALEELRRVLKPGGVLRLALPDLRKGVRAYVLGDDDYFKVDESEVQSLGGRFIVHMLWYGYSRTLFTSDFTAELLFEAGFTDIVECRYRETQSSFPEIVELDNRPDESFYIEATRPKSLQAVTYNGGVAHQVNVDVLGSSRADPDGDHLLGGRARALPGEDQGSLTIQGWVLGRGAQATAVELVNDGQVVAKATASLRRPDIAERFPAESGADSCGFRMSVRPEGKGESLLLVRAVLDDGTVVPIETIRVRVSRPKRRRWRR